MFRIQNVPQETLQPLVMIECPRLLFPFAREIIATAVRNGGFPPLLLDPVDFVALYQQRWRSRRSTPQAATTARADAAAADRRALSSAQILPPDRALAQRRDEGAMRGALVAGEPRRERLSAARGTTATPACVPAVARPASTRTSCACRAPISSR